MPTPLRLAVCLYPVVTVLDYQGPVELFGGIDPTVLSGPYGTLLFGENLPKYSIEITYFSHSLDPVKPLSGAPMIPSKTYSDALASGEQFDLVLVPGGLQTPQQVDPSLLLFLKKQAPGAKHVLTVCTGSWILSATGVLDGRRATTNKAWFKKVVEATKDVPVEWVAKARWVVDEHDDKKIWTSSGVTAGMDLGNAFLEYLVGKEHAEILRNGIELNARAQDDDPFAVVHGLV
ncbi:hypothetical protein PLICRDRAFT_112887 [Plicaturopsis crispa FD-325 SS-3]|nr:hypothetical protein PLICRDRAFT_112887 [Plicaturopsis crispa FD-325 SS-3]